MIAENDNLKRIAERRIKLINGISGNDEKAKRIKYSMYCRFGDLAQAMYSDKMKEGLIRGNKKTFEVLCDKTVYAWAFTGKSKSEEYTKAAEKYPEIQKLFNSLKEVQKGIQRVIEITSTTKENISFEEFVIGLSSFKSDSIVPIMDNMDSAEEDEFEDTGYFDDEEDTENGEEREKVVGVGNANVVDIATIDRQIAEAEADLNSGDLDGEAIEAVKLLIGELKLLRAEAQSGPKDIMEVKEEYDGELAEGVAILKGAGANFVFTKKEIKALDKAFESVDFTLKEDKDAELTNFVAVKRGDFSATFIFSTLGMLESKRRKFKEVFLAYTGYAAFGEIDSAPYGRQDWWAIECITNNRKFIVAEWPGTDLPSYKDLGNLRKIWVGSSLRERYLSIDWLDPQNSFNLIGGKSRSGKTCLSHAMLIQGICGGMLPTFLDWKPEGSELYRELGFYTVQRDARAWLPQGMEQGLHLLNIMDALAWLKSVSVLWSNREIGGKRDFDKNGLATPEDPSVIFVFDEIAAFMGSLGAIRVSKKSDKDLSPQEKATKAVTDYANNIFKGLNTCLAACATYGIKFMGITQDIMMSDSVWADKAWGGDEGKNFRKKMLNTFWGRGSVRGLDCPITEQKERSYVNMGQGRFGFEQNGQSKTFRALRIDNTVNTSYPGLDAAAVLNNCIAAKGIGLPNNRYNYFEQLMANSKSAQDFIAVINTIRECYSGTGVEQDDTNEYNSGIYASKLNSAETDSNKGRIEINSPISKTPEQPSFNGIPDDMAGMAGIAKQVIKDEQMEIERRAMEEFQRANKVENRRSAVNQNNEDISTEDILNAVNRGDLTAEEALHVLVEKRPRPAASMGGKGGRQVTFDTSSYGEYSKIDSTNSIDCRKASPGALSWIEKMTLETPAGAQRYITKLWRSILETVVSNGFKRANITRVSLYGGQMYVNGNILNLNGVIGGYECIRLKDIVSFRVLFKQLFMIRELRIDEEMLRAAVLELGDNAIGQMFSLATRLESIYIQAESGSINRFDRTNVQSAEAKRITDKSRAANEMDVYCNSKSNKSWANRLAGDNIWGMRAAKNSLSNAGRMFMDKNKPSVGKAALHAGAGLIVGTIGGLAWGTVKLVDKLFSIGSMFKR